MRNRKSASVVLCLALAPLTACGSKLEPPESICGIKIPSAALAPLLPEKGEVQVEKTRSIAMPSDCSINVDGKHYLDITHDPKTPIAEIPDHLYSRVKPRTFDGKLGISSYGAKATVKCTGKYYTIGQIRLSVKEQDGLYANSSKRVEKFMNAYMPALQKKYDCEG